MDEKHECPFPATHHKYEEAQYFLTRMLVHYHTPWEFQFNLNAFVQALRNITFMLQSEPSKPDGFEDWYKLKQSEMREDRLLRSFVEARNVIVKQSSLTSKSTAQSGLFRGRRLKLWIKHDLPLFMPTADALARVKKFTIGSLLDEAHSAIGEQIGVERTWIVEEIGSSEVVGHCREALNFMGRLVRDAHRLAGAEMEHREVELPMEEIQILLESDLDPTLLKKWGW